MKIEKVYLNNLRNDEHFQFNTEFRNLINEITPAALDIHAHFAPYLSLYAQEDEVLKKILKSALTEDIQNADRKRDLTFSGMIDANKSALKHFNSSIVTAAKRLKIVFDTYGNVARKPLNEETSAIYNLLQELKGTHAADVSTVGITDWVTELEADNNALTALMKARYDESALRTDLIMKEVRTQIDAAYHAITERIDALFIVNASTVHETFIHRWNVVIEKYKNILAQRQGRAAAKK